MQEPLQEKKLEIGKVGLVARVSCVYNIDAVASTRMARVIMIKGNTQALASSRMLRHVV